VDTLRADHLGYHGYTRKTSPTLDRFTEEAVAFMAHHSHASRTGPSVASIFTSLHVKSHGVVNPLDRWDGVGVLEKSRTTLAELLKTAGYRCGAIVANPNLYQQFGFSQGFDEYTPVHMHTHASVINSLAAKWITKAKDAPFFMYLHYMEPHSPYGSIEQFDRLFLDADYKGPITGEHLQLDEILKGSFETADTDKRRIVDLYDQDIRCFDSSFKELLGFLDEQELAENTVVAVLSDHGEEFFDHGGVLHGYTLYKDQLHVPLIIRAPGIAPARIESTTRNIDVLPTLLDLLGISAPEQIHGKSLVPLIHGAQAEDLPLFSEAGIRAVKTVKSRSFQVGHWKYIETIFPNNVLPEFYDLSADPKEMNNLIALKPKMAEKMKKEMDAFAGSLLQAKTRSVILDQKGLEQLKELGYIGE